MAFMYYPIQVEDEVKVIEQYLGAEQFAKMPKAYPGVCKSVSYSGASQVFLKIEANIFHGTDTQWLYSRQVILADTRWV